MTLVAVIADTHLPRGGRRLPEECVARLRAADVILHAGDFTSRSFLAELRALGPPLEAVHGNADERAVRAELPLERVVEIDGCRIAMVHDPGLRLGRERRLVSHFSGCDAVVYGHTHAPQTELCDGMLVLNPGSPTERRRSPTRSMLVLDVRPSRLDAELVPLS